MPGARVATAPITVLLTTAVLALTACGGAEQPPAASNGATAASSRAAQPSTTIAASPEVTGATGAALPETLSIQRTDDRRRDLRGQQPRR